MFLHSDIIILCFSLGYNQFVFDDQDNVGSELFGGLYRLVHVHITQVPADMSGRRGRGHCRYRGKDYLLFYEGFLHD